jgi:hypothetical protein
MIVEVGVKAELKVEEATKVVLESHTEEGPCSNIITQH